MDQVHREDLTHLKTNIDPRHYRDPCQYYGESFLRSRRLFFGLDTLVSPELGLGHPCFEYREVNQHAQNGDHVC